MKDYMSNIMEQVLMKQYIFLSLSLRCSHEHSGKIIACLSWAGEGL